VQQIFDVLQPFVDLLQLVFDGAVDCGFHGANQHRFRHNRTGLAGPFGGAGFGGVSHHRWKTPSGRSWLQSCGMSGIGRLPPDASL
jgi:hypothetical protein